MFCSALGSPYTPAFKNLVTRDWTARATLAPLAKCSLSGSSDAPLLTLSRAALAFARISGFAQILPQSHQ